MAEKTKMVDEFKKFVLRGNVMDMAVGIIIGTAFTAIVRSLVAASEAAATPATEPVEPGYHPPYRNPRFIAEKGCTVVL